MLLKWWQIALERPLPAAVADFPCRPGAVMRPICLP